MARETAYKVKSSMWDSNVIVLINVRCVSCSAYTHMQEFIAPISDATPCCLQVQRDMHMHAC